VTALRSPPLLCRGSYAWLSWEGNGRRDEAGPGREVAASVDRSASTGSTGSSAAKVGRSAVTACWGTARAFMRSTRSGSRQAWKARPFTAATRIEATYLSSSGSRGVMPGMRASSALYHLLGSAECCRGPSSRRRWGTVRGWHERVHVLRHSTQNRDLGRDSLRPRGKGVAPRYGLDAGLVRRDGIRHGFEKTSLAAEVVDDSRPVLAGLIGDRVDGDAAEAVTSEDPLGGVAHACGDSRQLLREGTFGLAD
jgi:hypothetical protein